MKTCARPFVLEEATKRYLRLSTRSGGSVQVEKGSRTENVLRQIETDALNVFASRDIDAGIETSDVSNVLHRLAKRHVLDRTSDMVWLDYPAPEYIYSWPGTGRGEVEDYLASKLSGRPGVTNAYLTIHRSRDVWTSFEVRERLEVDPSILRSTYVGAGLLCARREHVSGGWYEWFFYSEPAQPTHKRLLAESLRDNTDNEENHRGEPRDGSDATQPIDVSGRIRAKKARLYRIHRAAPERGARLESALFDGFNALKGGFEFRLVDVKKQVRRTVGGRARIFDIVLEFLPYIDGEVAKYASKRLVLVVEAKDTPTGAAVVNQHKIDVENAYPSEGAVPVVATTNPTDSAFNAFRNYFSLILTGKQLESIMEKSVCREESPAQSPAHSVDAERRARGSSRPAKGTESCARAAPVPLAPT